MGKLLGIITDCGVLRIWDIEQNCKAVLSTTCSEVFGKYGNIIQFNITEHGIPLLLFGNGNSYSYSENMQCWLVIKSKDPLLLNGLQNTLPKEFQRNYSTFPLTSVQSAGNFAATSSSSNSIDL